MQLNPETSRLVSASLLRLRLHSPYFAALALFARVEATIQVPTAATDGRDIFLNQDFFAGLTYGEQDGLLLHEVLHAALLHVPRRGTREPEIWNVAADFVINGMIARETAFALPVGGLRNYRLEHLSVEEVYDLLIEDRASLPTLPWADLLGKSPSDGESPASLSRAALEGHWRNARHQASLVARATGQVGMPGGLAREIGPLESAQLDWRAYLWRFLVRTPVDFDAFDRRFVGQRQYLETLSGESVRIEVAIDTSGSVSDRQLTTFVGEVAGIVSAYPHLRCSLYYSDTELHGPFPISDLSPMPAPLGGGGTDFRPFFHRMEEQRDLVTDSLLVYLTDGEGAFPDQPPVASVLWVVTPGGRDLGGFPFGEATRLLMA